MCDAFLTLAKVSPDGASTAATAADPKIAPSCFLVPRWKPDGERNTGFQVLRDTLNCSHCTILYYTILFCTARAEQTKKCIISNEVLFITLLNY